MEPGYRGAAVVLQEGWATTDMLRRMLPTRHLLTSASRQHAPVSSLAGKWAVGQWLSELWSFHVLLVAH